MVAYPDRGEGNDPEPFFFFFFFFFLRGVGSLSQPRLNIFPVDNMGVMTCLGQGGLRSLSASSFIYLANCIDCTSPCNVYDCCYVLLQVMVVMCSIYCIVLCLSDGCLSTCMGVYMSKYLYVQACSVCFISYHEVIVV